mgnify:CR=1 FL=1
MGKKNLFNFYLDDDDKQAITEKLDRLCGDTSKGKLAAFLRCQIKKFINTPDKDVEQSIVANIVNEYSYNQDKNKRSRL